MGTDPNQMPETTRTVAAVIADSGEMAAIIQSHDWASTPIGPPKSWSPTLRLMVNFMLANRFPLLLWWGPEYVSIYNDAYSPILGTKHPSAIGLPCKECWSEIWPILKPLIDSPFNGGPSTWIEDLALELKRHGFTEEAHFTVAYSPVPDDSARNGIGGVLATVHEITEKIVGERRIGALRDLATPAEAKTAEEACTVAASVLSAHEKDIPFALIYLIDPVTHCARLAGATGVSIGAAIAPTVIALDESAAMWPLAHVLQAENSVVVDSLPGRFSDAPTALSSDPPHTAMVVPIKSNIAHELSGFFVAAASPRLKFDEQYKSFLELAATQIATAISTARAYEAERKRAEALAEIDRAKTLFFSNVSHEFRTPLTLMLGPLEDALASADIPATEREKLDTARRNSLRLLKLVNSLLDFSRIEAGRAQANYEPVDLAALTADLASNFRSACERVGLDLLVDCPPLAEPVYVDRDMWEKIVLNLLSNAFKFTFAGRIAIRLRQVDGQAELRVSDSGVGIPPHEVPRLFERFHRIEGQRSRSYEGSGIGLALVQELVKLHQGAIGADSAVSRGTTFTVTIPLGSSHLPPQRIAAASPPVPTAVRAETYVEEALRWLPDNATAAYAVPAEDGRSQNRLPQFEGAHILLADDNADMRAYIRRLLGPDCQVQTVADGQAAIEAIRARPPDLVLADVMMPRLDGLGLARAIRDDPGVADLPVILLSARAGEEAKLQGLNAGADDYLVKPFSGRELLASVAANLRLAKLRQQSAAQFETLLNRAPLGVYLVDAAFRIRQVNPIAQAVFGDIPGGIVGRDFDEIIHTVWEKTSADDIVAIFRQTLATGQSYIAAKRAVLRPDRATSEYYEWHVDRIVLPDGNFGLVCYFRDIAERVHAETTRELLLAELNHRVKNTLANVQAIAQQTVRSTKDPSDFAARFSGRIQSMARVHALLTASTWKGADLQDLIRDQLLQGALDQSRLTARGPAVHLEPQIAVHVALMLHELGTNSVKHGAHSAAGGRVTINWFVAGGMLNLQWVERGGPAVSAPARRGFGTTLIEQSAKSEGGRAEELFEPEGITWKITLALPDSEMPQRPDHIRPALPAAAKPEPIAPARPAARLAGLRLLIVEDESLIALDLMDRLEIAGAEVAPAASTEKEALQAVEEKEFDCALLDANLHGRPVDAIAAALTRRNIPFVFVTGYGRAGLPASFQQVPTLSKPVGDQELLDAIAAIISRPNKVLRLKQ